MIVTSIIRHQINVITSKIVQKAVAEPTGPIITGKSVAKPQISSCVVDQWGFLRGRALTWVHLCVSVSQGLSQSNGFSPSTGFNRNGSLLFRRSSTKWIIKAIPSNLFVMSIFCCIRVRPNKMHWTPFCQLVNTAYNQYQSDDIKIDYWPLNPFSSHLM